MNILQINSSARVDGSHSTRLGNTLVERLRAGRIDTALTVRDLARNPQPALDEAALGALFTPAEQRTPEQAARVERRYWQLALTIHPRILRFAALWAAWRSYRRYRGASTAIADIAKEQALNEQEPGAKASDCRHLIPHDGAEAKADRCP